MTDYRITVKVQNNNILKRIYDAEYSSVNEFCLKNNICASLLGKIINMKHSPLNPDGKFKIIIHKCANALLVSPEDLFSETQLNTELESNKRTIEVEEAEMIFMLEQSSSQKHLEDILHEDDIKKSLSKALDTLTPKEKKVIEMRMGLGDSGVLTLKEVGREFGLTRERIRGIEAKALRKLRHPSRELSGLL